MDKVEIDNARIEANGRAIAAQRAAHEVRLILSRMTDELKSGKKIVISIEMADDADDKTSDPKKKEEKKAAKKNKDSGSPDVRNKPVPDSQGVSNAKGENDKSGKEKVESGFELLSEEVVEQDPNPLEN